MTETTPQRMYPETLQKLLDLQEEGFIPNSKGIDTPARLIEYVTDQFERLIKAKREQEQEQK